MKKWTMLLLTVTFCICSYGQGHIFKNYKEFATKTGTPFTDEQINTLEGTQGSQRVIFKNINGHQNARYKPSEIWGFTFKGRLFRSCGKQFAMLEDSTGKIFFYSSGMAGLQSLITDDGHGYHMVTSSTCFLQLGGIDGLIYGMTTPNGFRKDYPILKKEHPELQSLYDCMKKSSSDDLIWLCVKRYNEAHP